MISPNGDGVADSATITYTTNATATVDAALLAADGTLLGVVAAPARLAAGVHTLTFDGLGQPDGVYTIVITAAGSSGLSVSQQVQVAVSRTLEGASLSPPLLTPNGDGIADVLDLTFQLAAPAMVRLRVLREGTWVATTFSGPLEPGPQSLRWDGTKRVGTARDGAYTAILEVTDTVGTSTVELPFQLDAHAPTIKLSRPPRAPLGLRARHRDRSGQRLAPASGREGPGLPGAARDPQGEDDRGRGPGRSRQPGRLPPSVEARRQGDGAGTGGRPSKLAGCNLPCASAVESEPHCGPSRSPGTTDSAIPFSCDAPKTETLSPSRRCAPVTPRASSALRPTCSRIPRTPAMRRRTPSRSCASSWVSFAARPRSPPGCTG